jgi:hypothetical protein
VVTGARSGHVQQPEPLSVHLGFFVLPDVFIARSCEVPGATRRARPDVEVQEGLLLARHGHLVGLRPCPEVGERDNRELEAFGAMHRHDPHDVVGLLRDRRLDLVRLILERTPQMADEGPEPSPTGGREQARTVNNRQQVSGSLFAVVSGEGELDQVCALDDASHDLGERQGAA